MPDSYRDRISPAEEPEPELGASAQRVLRSLIRRRWLVAGAAVCITFTTIAITLHLPNRYTSEATIFAVQQRVPERYVVPTTTSDPGQVLEAMIQEVLSRPRLLAIIDDLELHREERKHLKSEQLLELVRRDLKVEPLERMLGRGEVNAFRISFIAETPQLAQAVTQRLVTLFIEENRKARADQATTTTEFLNGKLAAVSNDLQAKEQQLRDFKMKYLGELPEQHAGNVGILGSVQSQLNNVMASRNQAQQQRLYLDSLIGEYERRGKRPKSVRSITGEILTPLHAAENDLIRLQTERENLLAAYTPRHPNVLQKEAEIAVQQRRLRSLESGTVPTPDKPATNPEDLQDSEQDLAVAQLRSQLSANKLELDNLTNKEQKLQGDVDIYQSRLNVTPVREQQLASMQRDYDLLKQHYGELLKKQQEAQLATDLERRQEGQQFRLADPPNLPTMPSKPKRFTISLIGVLGGLVFGCAMAVLLEFKNPSLYEEKDADGMQLPLVVGIPLLLTPAEERSRSHRRTLEWVAASAILAVIAYAELYVFRHG